MTIPVSIFLYCLALKGPALPPPDVRPLQDTMLHRGVTAHRGNSAEFVENTLPAFQSAIALQVDWVELDIHRTRGDKIVANHDRTPGRTGAGDLSIAESTYEERKSGDSGPGCAENHGLSLA